MNRHVQNNKRGSRTALLDYPYNLIADVVKHIPIDALDTDNLPEDILETADYLLHSFPTIQENYMRDRYCLQMKLHEIGEKRGVSKRRVMDVVEAGLSLLRMPSRLQFLQEGISNYQPDIKTVRLISIEESQFPQVMRFSAFYYSDLKDWLYDRSWRRLVDKNIYTIKDVVSRPLREIGDIESVGVSTLMAIDKLLSVYGILWADGVKEIICNNEYDLPVEVVPLSAYNFQVIDNIGIRTVQELDLLTKLPARCLKQLWSDRELDYEQMIKETKKYNLQFPSKEELQITMKNQMKICAISSYKGGTGKTTTCVNLAFNLANEGARVLVVDTDPQANCTYMFTKVDSRSKTFSSLFKREPIKNCIYRSKFKNIDIIKGSSETEEIEGNVDILKKALEDVESKYDYCFIDCHPSMQLPTIAAMTAADILLIPFKPDGYGSTGLLILDDYIRQIRENYNFSLRYFVFITQFTKSVSQMATIKEMISKHNYPLLDTTVSAHEAVNSAILQRKPLFKHRRSSEVTEDYIQLATEVAEIFLNE